MRLPWPFGRSQAAPAEPESTSSTASPAVAPAPAAPGVAPPTGAWAALPPIQRATGEPPLVAPARTFLADVPGAQPLPPIVGQLGHDVTPLAPSGLVAAPVHSVASLTSNTALVGRPVQRHASGEEPAPEPERAPLQRSVSNASSSSSTSGPSHDASTDLAPSAAAERVEEPVRQLAVVPPGAAADVPARSLTRADVAAPPPSDRPLVQRTNVQASARSASSPSEASPQGTPTSASPAPAVQTAPDRATTVVDPASVSRPLPAAAPSTRRSGLGAPLAGPPPTAVARPSAPLATVQRRGAAARNPASAEDASTDLAPRASRPGSPSAPYVGSPRSPELARLPVVARMPISAAAADGSASIPGAGGSGHRDAEPRASYANEGQSAPPAMTLAAGPRTRSAAGADRPVLSRTVAPATTTQPAARPLAGTRPLRPSVAEPGAGYDEPAPSPSASPAGGGDTTSFGASWTNPALEALIGAPGLPAVAGQRPSAGVAVDRSGSPGSDKAGMTSGTGASVIQRSRQSAASMALARPAAGATAVAAGPASPFGPSIAYSTGSGQVPGLVAPSGSPTVVQMTPAEAMATPVLAPTATAIVQRADGPPPPAPAGGPSQRSDVELEELARALFPRFQRQLRMEYVYEREARGLPFDT